MSSLRIFGGFPFSRQRDSKDCGPSCLRMIATHYGKRIPLEQLRNLSGITREGVSLLGIKQAAESLGFETAAARVNLAEIHTLPLPAILHWDKKHFVVLYKIRNNRFYIADPAVGKHRLREKEFLQHWSANQVAQGKGVVLLLEPGKKFYRHELNNERGNYSNWGLIRNCLSRYKNRIAQILLCLLAGSVIQFIFPFLTQGMVDRGINQRDLRFIQLLLLAQFVLFFAQVVTDFIRARILLFVSTNINLSILSDFWKKLMKLPMQFFETRKTGDIIQRLNDHRRIEVFITGSALSTIFSVFSILVFSIVLFSYNPGIFAVFITGSLLYFMWIRAFLHKRRKLDQGRFAAAASESSATMQMLYGMQEIKLNNAEDLKRREWQKLQANLFRFNFRSLSLNQYQQAGAFFINQGKNILITFLVALAVLNGTLTLGQMVAVQFIIGQLNSPVEQLIQFIQQAQEARISLERLNEIQQLDEEELPGTTYQQSLPGNQDILIRSLEFTYPGAGNEPVFRNLNLDIPANQVTAIVGASGSGKTTLLKLLLKFYENYKGSIRIGKTNLKKIKPAYWRGITGSVMQDGYIFNDTIARNIALGDEEPDYEKLAQACRVAEIHDFIRSLPQGFETRIGAEGSGISAGQKQRLFIARAIYKDPPFLFFDEATNSLDANNEKAILENLDSFFEGRTVLVVAHRLSTVMNADKIVVLDKGVIVEEGTHAELSGQEGKYFELVKNQLEI
jgi:ATP-binding cassette, subfamily B, bacterial